MTSNNKTVQAINGNKNRRLKPSSNSASDHNGFSGDVLGVFGHEKRDDSSAVIGLTESSKRDHGAQTLFGLWRWIVPQGLAEVGADDARCDGVDADAAMRQRLRQRLGQTEQRRLRHAVRAQTDERCVASDRRHEHDVAATSLFHVRNNRFGQEKRGAHVRVEQLVPLFVGDIKNIAKMGIDGGVGHEDIDLAVLLDSEIDQFLAVFSESNMAYGAVGDNAAGLEAIDGFGDIVRLPTTHHDFRTIETQLLRDRITNAEAMRTVMNRLSEDPRQRKNRSDDRTC